MNPKSLLKERVKVLLKEVRSEVNRRRLSFHQQHYSSADVAADLRRIPFADGSIVFIHSSLRSLGYIDGGADTVVTALINVLCEEKGCTLAMPGFSINGTMYNTVKIGAEFDVLKTPTNIGSIPETFRKRAGVERSLHPTHSVLAYGPEAGWLVSEHHTCGTTFGPGSPLYKLIERNSYIMGLGTHLGTVTFYHVLEDAVPSFPVDVYADDSPFSVPCKDRGGHVHHVKVCPHDGQASKNRIDRPEGEWIRGLYKAALECDGVINYGKVAAAEYWFCEASAMYETIHDLLKAGVTIYSTATDVAKLIRGGEDAGQGA